MWVHGKEVTHFLLFDSILVHVASYKPLGTFTTKNIAGHKNHQETTSPKCVNVAESTLGICETLTDGQATGCTCTR